MPLRHIADCNPYDTNRIVPIRHVESVSEKSADENRPHAFPAPGEGCWDDLTERPQK